MRLGDENQKSSAIVWKCFVECWLRFLGHPETLVVDSGNEFQGDFAEACGANGIASLPIDPKAPWQNGRTERVGHGWKRQFKHAIRKGVPTEDSEFVRLGLLNCAVRNRYNNCSAFSPMQRVLGYTTRLSNSLLSDDGIDPEYTCDKPLSGLPEIRSPTSSCYSRVGRA